MYFVYLRQFTTATSLLDITTLYPSLQASTSGKRNLNTSIRELERHVGGLGLV